MPVKHLSDANPDGVVIGQTDTDKVAYYGKTPITQPKGTNQASIASTAITAVATTAITTVSTNVTGTIGFPSTTDYQSAVAAINSLITRVNALVTAVNDGRTRTEEIRVGFNQIRGDLVNLGLIKGSN